MHRPYYIGRWINVTYVSNNPPCTGLNARVGALRRPYRGIEKTQKCCVDTLVESWLKLSRCVFE